MTNPLTHYAIGLGIAYILGVRDRKVFLWAWLAVIPDMDLALGLPKWLWDLFNGGSFTTDLFHSYMNGMWNHRGIMHSYFAAVVLGLVFFIKTKKWLPAVVATVVYASHVFADVLDLWIVHPYLPFTFKVATNPLVHPYYPFTLMFTLLMIGAVYFAISDQKKNYAVHISIALFLLLYGYGIMQKAVVPIDVPFSQMAPINLHTIAAVQQGTGGFYLYKFDWSKEIQKQFIPKYIGSTGHSDEEKAHLYVESQKLSGFHDFSLVFHDGYVDALFSLDVYSMPYKEHGWVYRFSPKSNRWQEIRIEQPYVDEFVAPYLSSQV